MGIWRFRGRSHENISYQELGIYKTVRKVEEQILGLLDCTYTSILTINRQLLLSLQCYILDLNELCSAAIKNIHTYRTYFSTSTMQEGGPLIPLPCSKSCIPISYGQNLHCSHNHSTVESVLILFLAFHSIQSGMGRTKEGVEVDAKTQYIISHSWNI